MERRLGEGSPCELVVKKLRDVWGALKTTQYNAEARLQSHNQANIYLLILSPLSPLGFQFFADRKVIVGRQQEALEKICILCLLDEPIKR